MDSSKTYLRAGFPGFITFLSPLSSIDATVYEAKPAAPGVAMKKPIQELSRPSLLYLSA